MGSSGAHKGSQKQPAKAGEVRGANEMPDSGRTARLVAQARRGDGEAFGRLFRTHRQAVALTLLGSGVRSRIAAEDLAQDIALAAWKNLPTLKDPRAFAHWLRRIAANAARDHLRQLAIRREEELGEAVELATRDDPHERAERSAEFRLMVTALAAEDQECVSLLVARAEGVPASELARKLGVTPVALRMRALRVRKRLQKRLDRLRKGEPGLRRAGDCVTNRVFLRLSR